MRVNKMSPIPMLYHAHHSQAADDLPFWLDWARRKGGPILELGCGSGRVLLPLAEEGRSVFGLDRDANMLEFLRMCIPGGLRERVSLIRSDLRRYHLARHFPLILMPCNTYSTLEPVDRRIALNRARCHLASRGNLIVSTPNPAILAELPEEGEAENEAFFFHPETGNPVQVSSQWQRASEGILFYWRYDQLLPDGRVEREMISVFHYVRGVDDTFYDFEEAGLKVALTFGDYDGAPYETDSPHLIIVATPIFRAIP